MAPSWLQTPAVVARCAGVPEWISRRLDLIGSLRDLFATAAAVVDIFPIFSEVATGTLYQQFDVNLCAACPQQPIPECAVSGGALVCGAAAVQCARHPSNGQACTAGTGLCRAPGTFECVGTSTTPLCNARAGIPRAESCTGGVDEDCDGAADCADSDCTANPACARCAPDRCSTLPPGTAAACLGSTAVTCRSVGACLVESSATNCVSAFPRMTGRCSFGVCEPVRGTCAVGWGDCDGVASNGCEQDLLSSAAHCGGCGRPCAVGEVCSASACRSSCMAPSMLCSGTCINPASDLRNCGACGVVCAAANGSALCSSGRCVVSACAAGRGDCDATYSNGCEADLSSDAAHCGSCSVSCSRGSSCSSGRCACTPITCASSGRRCGSAPDGCGGTFTCPSCPLGQTCDASGACVSSCTMGTTWCSGACVDLRTDVRNCGSCGSRCATGETCSSGRCVASVCSDYLRILSPSAGAVRAGSVVQYRFTAPGCPASQQYVVAFRQCCSNRLDCTIGYSPGVDPDLGCPGTSTAAFSGTTVNVTLPMVSGRWRTSVYPVGQNSLAAPFVVLNFTP